MTAFRQKQPGENPFHPGFGEPPPFLAGRQAEQDALAARIDGLALGGSRRPFIIYGPRGMGKTSLLEWIAEESRNRAGRTWTGRQKLSVIVADGSDMLASEANTLGLLLPAKGGRKAVELGAEASMDGMGGLGGTVRVQRPGISFINAAQHLIAACKKRPLLLLIDEAHVVSSANVYRSFLSLVQAVIGKAPLLLVLAGTPDLPDALSSVGAAFISRSQLLGVALLEKDEAKRAIREPLAEDGIQIDEEALSLAAEDSQRYPYFLQVWGAALWDAAVAQGRRRLTLADAQAVRPSVQQDKSDFYDARYTEVHADKLTRAAAVALANAFGRADRFTRSQLLDIVEEALSPLLPEGDDLTRSANERFKTLLHLGFVWRKPGETTVSAGIPSLMHYIASQIREERAPYAVAAR